MNLRFAAFGFAVAIAIGVCATSIWTKRSPQVVRSGDGSISRDTKVSTPAEDYRVLVVDPNRSQALAAEIVRASQPAATPVKVRKKFQVQTSSDFEMPRRVSNGKPAPVAPEARVALTYVGSDEAATEIWRVAINDPSVPPTERQDLIEDLNEEGFADPHHITEEDLPLILSRLALIEDLAPDSIDEVNSAAFAEVHKDLANMVDRLTQE
jgi:hypothetical protein